MARPPSAKPLARLNVYCQPGARQTVLAGRHAGLVKIRLHAPPVEGAANAALVAFVARLCGVAPSAVAIESGAHSRTKRLAVVGLAQAALEAALDPDRPTSVKT